MKMYSAVKVYGAFLMAVVTAVSALIGGNAEENADGIRAVREEIGTGAYSGYLSGSAVDGGLSGTAPAAYVPSGTTLTSDIELPSYYKTETTGIRDQGSLNTCWAFSGIGAMEAFLSRDGKGDHDLSEQHLSWWSTAEYNKDGVGWLMNDLNFGGYSMISAGYLISWQGAKTEEDVPYLRYNNDEIPESMDTAPNAYCATGIMYVNGDIDSVKTAVYKYGGVATSYNNGSGYNSDRSAYYQSNQASSYSGHAITVIGWDDNYPKENFDEYDRPEYDGAWLTKNSWGPNKSDNGYLWVSYYDRYMLDVNTWGANLAFTGVRTANDYDKLYQNEIYGATYFTYLEDSSGDFLDTATFANVFDFDEEHPHLQEVIFETQSQDADYDIYYIPMKKNKPDPDESTWLLLTSGHVDNTGYICADVSGKLDVTGEAAIGVKIRANPEYDYAKFGVDEWLVNADNKYVFKPDSKRKQSYVITGGKVHDLMNIYATNLDLIGGTLVIKAVASSDVMGDYNDDNVAAADDALEVLRGSVGLSVEMTDLQVKNCDVSYDGKITSDDALMILRKSVGLLAEF